MESSSQGFFSDFFFKDGMAFTEGNIPQVNNENFQLFNNNIYGIITYVIIEKPTSNLHSIVVCPTYSKCVKCKKMDPTGTCEVPGPAENPLYSVLVELGIPSFDHSNCGKRQKV